MASLLGKADSTLAAMSYKEAMADVTPDLKDVYKEEADFQKEIQTAVKDHFDIAHADANKLKDELKEATTYAMANLGNDTKAMELFNNELEKIKAISKSFPKDKKGDFERAKLRGELKKLKESTDGMVQTLYDVEELVNSDSWNPNASDQNKVQLLKGIAEGTAVMGIDNGEVFWSATGAEGEFKMDRHQLKKALVPIDPEVKKGVLETTKTFGTPTSVDQNFDFDGAANSYETSFTTKEALADSIHTKQGSLPYTFHEYLTKGIGAEELYKTLEEMGGFDVSGKGGSADGKVDKHDFITGDNAIALADSFNLGKPGYDFQKVKKIVSKFYATKLAGTDFVENKRLLKIKTDADAAAQVPKSAALSQFAIQQNQDQDNAAKDAIVLLNTPGVKIIGNTTGKHVEYKPAMTITEDEDGKKLKEPIEVPESWVLMNGGEVLKRIPFKKDEYTNQLIVNHVSGSSGKYNAKAMTLALGNQ